MPTRSDRYGFRLSTAFTAVVGTLALLLTGEAHPLLAWPALFIPLGYLSLHRGRDPLPRFWIGVLVGLDLLVFAADVLLISRDMLIAVLHLSIFFQALKSFDLNSLDDHTQVHFMGLLQIVIVSELTLSIWFAVLLLIFMVNLVVSLMDGYLNGDGGRERVPLLRPATPVALLTLLALVALFLAIPRTNWQGFWGRSHIRRIHTTGFSDAVDFGSFGTVKKDDTVVMRVELSGPVPFDLYWRGGTLERFDGVAWHSDEERTERIFPDREGRFRLRRARPGAAAVEQTIYLEPINTPVIFALAAPVSIEATFPLLTMDRSGVLRLPKEPRGRVRYRVRSDPRIRRDDSAPRPVHLEIPAGLSRLEDLARRAAGSHTDPRKQALALIRLLQSRYAYSLTTRRPPEGMSAVEDFLFETRRGYCEHFATALALMLRSLGTPTRIVTGFLGGERNPVGDYVLVRQSDAHAWVEAWFDGRWERLDPTPPAPLGGRSSLALLYDSLKMAWFKYVVSYSSLEQRRAVATLESAAGRIRGLLFHAAGRNPVLLLLGGALLAGCLWTAARLLRTLPAVLPGRRRHPYEAVLRRLARMGFPKRPGETAREHARRVVREGGPEEVPLLAETYYRDRYGGEDGRDRLREAARRLKKRKQGAGDGGRVRVQWLDPGPGKGKDR